MNRTARPILPAATCFITCTTHERKPLFANPLYAQIVVDQWKHYAIAYQFTLDAYCVLPDHGHVVLNVGKLKSISQILHAVNSYTATLINRQMGREIKVKIWDLICFLVIGGGLNSRAWEPDLLDQQKRLPRRVVVGASCEARPA